MKGIRTFATLVVIAWAAAPTPTAAQTIDDGIMLGKGELFAGSIYSHDSWDEYWEGTLKRDNGNIGELTTESVTWFGNYGVTRRLNVIAALPRVWTNASQGVLHGLEGIQDLTVAGKFAFVHGTPTPVGIFKAIGVLGMSIPLTDYTPDFLPLSIGLGSKRLLTRATTSLETSAGPYVTGSLGYTVRRSIELDRPYYFTDGKLFLTSEVDMPEVFDFTIQSGYMKAGVMAAVTYSHQRVLGGGDIRRQDMPFVSNRTNFNKVGGIVMLPIPGLRDLAVHGAYAYTLDGRNVGQSTTVSGGLSYRFHFLGRTAQ
jgi:hypothetical protein